MCSPQGKIMWSLVSLKLIKLIKNFRLVIELRNNYHIVLKPI